MLRNTLVSVSFAFAFVLALASTACGDGDKKPPLTPDSDKPAELIDAGSTVSPPPAK